MSNKLPTPEIKFVLKSDTPTKEYYVEIKTSTGKIINLYPNDLISFTNYGCNNDKQISIIDKITASSLHFYYIEYIDYKPSNKSNDNIGIGGTVDVQDYPDNIKKNVIGIINALDFRFDYATKRKKYSLELLDTIEILGRNVTYQYKDTPNGGQRKKRRTVRKRKYKRSLRKMH